MDPLSNSVRKKANLLSERRKKRKKNQKVLASRQTNLWVQAYSLGYVFGVTLG